MRFCCKIYLYIPRGSTGITTRFADTQEFLPISLYVREMLELVKKKLTYAGKN